MVTDALIVGTGRAGMNAVHHIQGETELDTACFDTDAEACDECVADTVVLVKEKNLVNYVDRGFEIDSEITLKEIEKIEHMFSPYKRVYVVGALGGTSGTVILPAVAKQAHDLRKDLVGELIMPFQIENRRRKIAEFYLDEIREFFTEVEVYDNSEYADRFEDTELEKVASLQKVFDAVNEDILRSIQEHELYEQEETPQERRQDTVKNRVSQDVVTRRR
jgi:cell division GTPase FtsZ